MSSVEELARRVILNCDSMRLYEELRKLVDRIEKAEIEYALCGGIALAIHGHPRFTRDIDILLRPADLHLLKRQAAEIGFKHDQGRLPLNSGVQAHRLTKIIDGEPLTLDILLADQALEPIWPNRAVYEWEGLAITVVSLDGLIHLKQLAGRPQDLVDLERLREEKDESKD